MRRPTLLLGLVLLCALGMGCHKAPQAEHPHVDGTLRADDAMKRFDHEDLALEGVKEVDPAPYRAGHCESGLVAKLDTVVCEYSTDDALDRSAKAFQSQWAKDNVNTALTVRAGKTLLAVADRQKTDPNGKALNKMVAAFKKP